MSDDVSIPPMIVSPSTSGLSETGTAAGFADGEVMFRRRVRRKGKVPLLIKVVQGVGSVPGQHKEWAFNTVLLIFYSQILGMPASSASLVLMISLIIDAVTDPIVGAYSDNLRSKYGRRHPLMLAAALPFALTLYMMFAPPDGLSNMGLFMWMLVTTVSMRIAFTFFALPWNAIAVELSEDYVERTNIITYRIMMGWIVGVMFVIAMQTWVFPTQADGTNGYLNRGSYPEFAVILAGAALFWMLITTMGTMGQVKYMPQPVGAVRRVGLVELVSQTFTALQNRNFRILFFSTLIASAIAGTGLAFEVYMSVYYWEFSTEELRWFLVSGLGAILSFMTAGLIQRFAQKQTIMIVSMLIVMVLSMIRVLFRFWDIWPENGDPNLLKYLVLHTTVVVYFANLTLIMFASAMADIADEQEYDTGLRQEGVFSAGILFASKATTGLGIFIVGIMLDVFVRFPRVAKVSEVPDDALFRLALTDGIIINSLYILPVFFLVRYSLTQERLDYVQLELKRRSDADHLRNGDGGV